MAGLLIAAIILLAMAIKAAIVVKALAPHPGIGYEAILRRAEGAIKGPVGQADALDEEGLLRVAEIEAHRHRNASRTIAFVRPEEVAEAAQSAHLDVKEPRVGLRLAGRGEVDERQVQAIATLGLAIALPNRLGVVA